MACAGAETRPAAEGRGGPGGGERPPEGRVIGPVPRERRQRSGGRRLSSPLPGGEVSAMAAAADLPPEGTQPHGFDTCLRGAAPWQDPSPCPPP